MPAFTIDPVTALGAIVALVFWLARLEFLSKQNKSDIDTIKAAHDVHMDELRGEILSMSKTLARIEGQLLSITGKNSEG